MIVTHSRSGEKTFYPLKKSRISSPLFSSRLRTHILTKRAEKLCYDKHNRPSGRTEKQFHTGVVALKVSELTARYSFRNILEKTTARKLLSQLVCFGIGFIASGGSIFDTYTPFGISVIAAVPFGGIFSSFIGAAVGYMIFAGRSSPFRYLAAMIAVAAIRWTLNDIKRLQRYSLYAAVVCFVPTLATGLAAMSVSGFQPESAIAYSIEALLSAGAAYFFSRTNIILQGTKSLGMLTVPEVSCLAFSGCIALLALSGIRLGPLSLGHIAAVLCILLASRYGSAAGGAIAGTAAGVVLSFGTEGFFFISAAYAFGGLLAGLFSHTGRIVSSLVFLTGGCMMALQTGHPENAVTLFYEGAIASLIFCLLPKTTGNFLSAIFFSGQKDVHSEGLRRSIIMRLDFAAKALSDVSTDVEEVAQKLTTLVTPTLDNVYEKAIEQTCSHCGLRVFCWEHREGVSLESFQSLNECLSKQGSIQPEHFGEDFSRKCCRTAEMAAAVNKSYQNYLASEAAAKRVDEVRSVVAGQFCGLGDILNEMADEYESYEFFDNELAESILMKCKELGLIPIDVSCRVDHLGRMTVEAEIYDEDRKKLQRNLIMKEISKLCGRHFDTPNITAAFGRCRILLCERPVFDVEIAASQHICGSGLLSGDHFRYFYDGAGRMTAVLSDGMGTGGRAAVDGGMAVSIFSKLIKAGLGFDCALKVVNSALLIKSEDESLATLDVISVDLYNGEVTFRKAGAALSFIRKNGDMYRVETPSLPIGILTDVEFTCTEDTLAPEDIIVIVSDGAVVCGEEWIERIILQWQDKSMQELAHLISRIPDKQTFCINHKKI